MIKIQLPVRGGSILYEGVWVEESSATTGRINNLPVFSRQYKYSDVIEFDPESHHVLRILEDGGYMRTRLIIYKDDHATAREKWERKGYLVESLSEGLLGVTKKRR